jgi:hypothetical protein
MPPCACCDKDSGRLKKGLCDNCYARQLRKGTTDYKVAAKTLPCAYCKREGRTVAKGLCNACYYRQKKNGTLEYKERAKPASACAVDGCDRPVVSREYCGTHHANNVRFGDPIRNFGYGERSSHPLYQTWEYQKRTDAGRVSEWDDFWGFVSDVGEKPSQNHTARRYDFKSPWGPSNFYWIEKIASGVAKKEYAREWRKRNPISTKSSSLKKSYGIDISEYMAMYEAQGGKCAICGKEKHSHCSETGRSQTLVVDHCHDKKHVRALLCSACNKGLGHFFDDAELMQKAVEYLRKHQK